MRDKHAALLAALAMVAGVPIAMAAAPLPTAVEDADYRVHDAEKVALGRLLMFDKILSGNRNISCGTCHHAITDTGDGLSLPLGEGGFGLGVNRSPGDVEERVPRNAPPVFNLGAKEFQVLFHDGRVRVHEGFPNNSNCETPAGADLPDTLENVLACQAMFPVTSPAEMAGQPSDNEGLAEGQPGWNEIAPLAADSDFQGIWDALAARLQGVPEYVDLFKKAFNDVKQADDITYAHAANAIAAFEGVAWRADKTPFDAYLRGDATALSDSEISGMDLFYNGDSNGQACADCHSGKFQTDHQFYAIAMPQIGPGKGDNSGNQLDGRDDFGREQATGDPNDRLKFRTPNLRNVALTAPYGHAGAYDTLQAVVRHHLDSVKSLRRYDQSQAVLPPREDLDEIDFVVMDDGRRVNYIADYNQLSRFTYTEEQVDRIIDFLHALTDPASLDLRRDQPLVVPSGLPATD
jgi:cytochrome c peroxidase